MLLAGVGNVDAKRSSPNFMVVDSKTTTAQVTTVPVSLIGPRTLRALCACGSVCVGGEHSRRGHRADRGNVPPVHAARRHRRHRDQSAHRADHPPRHRRLRREVAVHTRGEPHPGPLPSALTAANLLIAHCSPAGVACAGAVQGASIRPVAGCYPPPHQTSARHARLSDHATAGLPPESARAAPAPSSLPSATVALHWHCGPLSGHSGAVGWRCAVGDAQCDIGHGALTKPCATPIGIARRVH